MKAALSLNPGTIELFGTLIRRELANRYKGSLLGGFWPLIFQLSQLLVFTYVFSYILKVHLTLPQFTDTTFTFGVWVFAGLLPWTAFVAGVTQGSNAILSNASTVKKVVFPLVLLPLVPVVASFVEAMVGLPILTLFMGLLFHTFRVLTLFIWIVWVPQLLLTAGLSLLFSSISVFVRDIPLALNPLFLVLFYLTPIVYPQTVIPPALAAVIAFNPLVGLVAMYRDLLVTGEVTHQGEFGIALLISAVIFSIGLFVFVRLSPRFADEL